MKTIKKYIGRLIYSVIIVYSLNILLIKFNIFLPINYFSVVIYTLFGFPGIILMILLVIKYR